MKAIFSHSIALLLVFLAGCVQAQSPPNQEATVPVEIQAVAEGESFRDAASQGYGSVTWSAEPGGYDAAAAIRAAREAIGAAAQRLSATDYVALSLPDFVTPTRSLQLNEQHFRGGDAAVDAYAEAAGGQRLALVVWEGPEIEQLPDRPLVDRWVQVYALYDLGKKQIVRLVPTIGGQVLE